MIDVAKYDCKEFPFWELPHGEGRNRLRKLHRKRQDELNAQFRLDIQQALMDAGVPAKYVRGCVEYAWEEGHANGFSEVVIHASEIAEVIFGVRT